MAQCVEKQIGTIPAVEAKAHLVQIGLQVLCAETMPRSDDAALEQREGRFHGVRVNVGSEADVFFSAMVYGLMPRFADSLAIRAGIRR